MGLQADLRLCRSHKSHLRFCRALAPQTGSGCVCVGGGGGGNLLYMAYYGCACRIASFFQSCQVYDWPPFFNKTYMNDPFFFRIPM